jgi:phosphopantetheinyl transferase (holo-ACP synthase)
MIGIDLVDLTRFETTPRLSQYLSRFHVDGTTPLAAAKTWACLEAIIKAEDQPFDPTQIHIRFPKGHRPTVSDPKQVLSGNYVLSVSHEAQMVIAIAIKA